MAPNSEESATHLPTPNDRSSMRPQGPSLPEQPSQTAKSGIFAQMSGNEYIELRERELAATLDDVRNILVGVIEELVEPSAETSWLVLASNQLKGAHAVTLGVAPNWETSVSRTLTSLGKIGSAVKQMRRSEKLDSVQINKLGRVQTVAQTETLNLAGAALRVEVAYALKTTVEPKIVAELLRLLEASGDKSPLVGYLRSTHTLLIEGPATQDVMAHKDWMGHVKRSLWRMQSVSFAPLRNSPDVACANLADQLYEQLAKTDGLAARFNIWHSGQPWNRRNFVPPKTFARPAIVMKTRPML